MKRFDRIDERNLGESFLLGRHMRGQNEPQKQQQMNTNAHTGALPRTSGDAGKFMRQSGIG